jgi:hypothetical protein
MEHEELKLALREALNELLAIAPVEIARKWVGGEIVFQPANPSHKPYRLPIDSFFHKIVMIRDRMRVLEAKINAHPGLSDAEKVEMQQYITRVYGSLTSFNILFEDREDSFKGAGGQGTE